MKKCFGYVRVSTVKQGEGVSLEAQREAIQRFANSNHIEITRWFEEKETAAKQGRPVFTAMTKALRRGQAAGVVIHKIDRSARNFKDWALIGDLADAGIDIHFATESLDFRSRGGRLAADIQAVIAADYIRNLREETIKGLTGRLKQGLYPFRAPIGYVDNGGGKPKTIDPVQGPLVRQAFELYGTRQYSFVALLSTMAGLGLRNYEGRPISLAGLEAILRNPFYCGIIRVCTTGETYAGIHEPLISVSLFEEVQEIKAGKAGKKVTRHNHLYRGLFRCALCGGAMTPEKQKGHVYYRCARRYCPTRCVREEAITDVVLECLGRFGASQPDAATITERMAAWHKGRRKSDPAKQLRLQLAQCDQRLERLADAVLDELIDRPTYLKRREVVLLEKAGVEERLKELAGNTNDAQNLTLFLELMKTLENLYISANPGEKRQMLEELIPNRVVSEKNVCVEPIYWLQEVENVLSTYEGAQSQPTSRRHHELKDEQIERLLEIVCSEECRKTLDRLARIGGQANATRQQAFQ